MYESINGSPDESRSRRHGKRDTDTQLDWQMACVDAAGPYLEYGLFMATTKDGRARQIAKRRTAGRSLLLGMCARLGCWLVAAGQRLESFGLGQTPPSPQGAPTE